eukprot:9469600-Pyramimonas_sp.AAC.1
MHIPHPGCPPYSSSVVLLFGEYIHSLPRVVGETLENEGWQITGDSEDEAIGGREGRARRREDDALRC